MSVPTTPLSASILIVNYNYGRYLADAIDSALAQTWPHVQVVVVDDGSTDESALVMESYGPAIQTIYQENAGQAAGMNAGFPLLAGEAVIFLDADDLLEPTAVEKTIGFFADPAVVKVHWPMRIIDRDSQPTGEIRFTDLPEGDLRAHALRWGPANHRSPACSGNFWRRSALESIFPIPPEEFRTVADAYLFGFAPLLGELRAWPEPLTSYRIHGENVSSGRSAAWHATMWEIRAVYLSDWLQAQGAVVSIDRWRRANRYYRRMRSIAEAHRTIGRLVPADSPVALIAGPLFNAAEVTPRRSIHQAPTSWLSPDRTEDDFRTLLHELPAAGVGYLALQGRRTWPGTNLALLAAILETEYSLRYTDDWIVIAELNPRPKPIESQPENDYSLDTAAV